jgi:hypothetical protein
MLQIKLDSEFHQRICQALELVHGNKEGYYIPMRRQRSIILHDIPCLNPVQIPEFQWPPLCLDHEQVL